MTDSDVQTLADALRVPGYVVRAALSAVPNRRGYLRMNEPELFHRGVRRPRQVTTAIALTLELGRAGVVWEVPVEGIASGLTGWIRSHPAVRDARVHALGDDAVRPSARFRSLRGLAGELSERGLAMLLIDASSRVRAVAVVDEGDAAAVGNVLNRLGVGWVIVEPRAMAESTAGGA